MRLIEDKTDKFSSFKFAWFIGFRISQLIFLSFSLFLFTFFSFSSLVLPSLFFPFKTPMYLDYVFFVRRCWSAVDLCVLPTSSTNFYSSIHYTYI